MDFDVLGTQIISCKLDFNLIIKGERSYDRPEIIFLNVMAIDGLWDIEGKEILCIEKIESGLYKIKYKDEKEGTTIYADRYEKIINN